MPHFNWHAHRCSYASPGVIWEHAIRWRAREVYEKTLKAGFLRHCPPGSIFSRPRTSAGEKVWISNATEFQPADEDEPADEAGSANDPVNGDPPVADHGAAGTHRPGAGRKSHARAAGGRARTGG